MAKHIRTTPLHDWHLAQGANMAAFGGYSMPLWYRTGAKQEHLAAIRRAALFDTSHMAVIALEGSEARALLQHCATKDLDRCLGARFAPLVPGRSVYTVLLNEQGHVVDDAIIFQTTPLRYLVVVNASMGETVAEHFRVHASPAIEILDLTDRIGKIDLQGPAAASVLARYLRNPSDVLEDMIPFSFKGSLIPEEAPSVQWTDGSGLLVSRTGYTGEFGFELFLSPDKLSEIWETLATDPNVMPAGLAARDSLRAGAGLPLSHQDIGPWPFAANPWLFVLPFNPEGTGYTKDFLGRACLETLPPQPATLAFAGYDPRKIATGPESRVTTLDGQPLGTILTCATDMAIDRVDGRIVSIATPRSAGRPEDFTPRGLCCGFVRLTNPPAIGSEVLLTDGRRSLKVELRKTVRPDRSARRAMRTMLA